MSCVSPNTNATLAGSSPAERNYLTDKCTIGNQVVKQHAFMSQAGVMKYVLFIQTTLVAEVQLLQTLYDLYDCDFLFVVWCTKAMTC